MKILVTGAGGFIGSHVTETLLQDGHFVRALVHYSSTGSWGHLEHLRKSNSPNLEIVLGDVTDSDMMAEAVIDCDCVLHLAALIGIPYSYVAPRSYLMTNTIGTLNILQACRNAKIRRVVITSTSEVYGSAIYCPIDESHPLQGQSPYSASKISADKLAESYFCSFDLPVVTLRPFNTYGPRQSARAIIPTILTQALSGASTIALGSMTPKRDLTFVEDTARAFALAATTPGIDGQTIHFGQGSAISIAELARACLDTVGSKASIVSSPTRVRPSKSEVSLLLCNADKAKSVLSWAPETDLKAGLIKTAEYLKENLHLYRQGRYAV